MEAQQLISFEYKKDERTYTLNMVHGAPLGEAYEACSAFLNEVVRLINEHAEMSQPKDPDESEEKADE